MKQAFQPMSLVKKLMVGACVCALGLTVVHAQENAQPSSEANGAAAENKALNLDQRTAVDGPTQEALRQMVETEGGAVFRGLDKVTARVSTVYAPIDEMVTFGSLHFVTRQCNKRPPEEPPEKTAFLEVKDVKPDQSEEDIFNGWMFASSPALNALEHPVYDIWLIDCIIVAPDVPEGIDENSAG